MHRRIIFGIGDPGGKASYRTRQVTAGCPNTDGGSSGTAQQHLGMTHELRPGGLPIGLI